jgi:hypothetical protein
MLGTIGRSCFSMRKDAKIRHRHYFASYHKLTPSTWIVASD